MALGLGKPDADTLLFGEADGSPRRPDQLSWLWRSACKSRKLPMVSFHAFRHTHASALIAAPGGVVAMWPAPWTCPPQCDVQHLCPPVQQGRQRGGHRGRHANKERTEPGGRGILGPIWGQFGFLRRRGLW